MPPHHDSANARYGGVRFVGVLSGVAFSPSDRTTLIEIFDLMSDSMPVTIPAIPHDRVGGVARFGRRPHGALLATSCVLLWPATVIFAMTGSLTSALVAAAGAWVFRHAWEGGARAAAERMRVHGFLALRTGRYRRAKRIYERLWSVRPAVRARFSFHELCADRLNYATSLVLVGQARQAAGVLCDAPTESWQQSAELHQSLGALSRRLAERLLEARQPTEAREMLRLSEACAEWRADRRSHPTKEEHTETGWLWLRLGGVEAAIDCFLRALQNRPRRSEAAVHERRADTGPYRVVSMDAAEAPLRDDSPDLGLAEAYLRCGRYQAALEEFNSTTRREWDPTGDSPIAWGRAERGRARSLVLLGRHEEAVVAFERALKMDLQGDLRFGGAVHDCLELTSVHRHLGDEVRAQQTLQQATVMAVRPCHREMIDAFVSGSPISVERALWSDVPVPARDGGSTSSGPRVAGEEANKSLAP